MVHTWTIFTTAGSPELLCFHPWEVDDVTTAGEAVWSGVHGHTTLELTGFFRSVGRDPVRSYSEILTRMSIGLGDHALATARSLSTARRRAVRADRAEAASAR